MADTRLRRSRSGQHKPRDNPSVIIEEDEVSRSESTAKTVITKPKDATVEVTVKVKKRRDKTSESSKKILALPQKDFRKGESFIFLIFIF